MSCVLAFLKTLLGCVSSVTVIVTENRIGKKISNSGLVICTHFHTNTVG